MGREFAVVFGAGAEESEAVSLLGALAHGAIGVVGEVLELARAFHEEVVVRRHATRARAGARPRRLALVACSSVLLVTYSLSLFFKARGNGFLFSFLYEMRNHPRTPLVRAGVGGASHGGL